MLPIDHLSAWKQKIDKAILDCRAHLESKLNITEDISQFSLKGKLELGFG
jgi:hypothetical protein